MFEKPDPQLLFWDSELWVGRITIVWVKFYAPITFTRFEVLFWIDEFPMLTTTFNGNLFSFTQDGTGINHWLCETLCGGHPTTWRPVTVKSQAKDYWLLNRQVIQSIDSNFQVVDALLSRVIVQVTTNCPCTYLTTTYLFQWLLTRRKAPPRRNQYNRLDASLESVQ